MNNARNVQIVTDSASDIPAEVVARLGITVVPLLVNFGTEEFKDRVDLDIAEFWRRCAETAELPQTATPSAGVFEQTYREVAGAQSGGDPSGGTSEIVAIILSGALSATIEAARMGAQAVAPDIAVTVVDSNNVSIAQGQLVMLAAEMAQAGAASAEIERTVNDAIGRTHLYATLDTLENLRKGGRIGAAQSLLGSVLSIKPLIKIADGEVKPDGKQRTRTKALAHLYGLVEAQAGDIEQLAVIHAEAKDAGEFAQRLAPLMDTEIMVTDIGPVVSVHAGIGAIGVAFRTRSGAGEADEAGAAGQGQGQVATDQVAAGDEQA